MKKFFASILSPLHSPLLLVIVAFLYYCYVSEDVTGDLGRNAQIVFSKDYRMQNQFEENIQKELYWCSTEELSNYDLVFMGDSFTKLCFPYYLTNLLHKNTAKYFADNIDSPEQTFVSMCNTNVVMPKVVVLESVERSCIDRLVNLKFNALSIQPIASVYKEGDDKQTNFTTFYKNQIIDNHSVRHLHLKDSLFSCPKKEKDLYFYYLDLPSAADEKADIAVSKLDTLFALAREKNIHLFYVIAADKYDVYQDFTIDNTYQRKTVLDDFSRFDSNLYFVNSKSILLEKAEEGVKDLYYADDSHWSPIGARIVSEEIVKRMDSLGVFR